MTYKIGFLGAGRMASAMIKRLLSQGFDIKVWNRSQGKLAPLVALGAHACKSPADAANDVDAVISFMASDDAARDVWLDNKSGALSTMRPGTIAIECSTLSHGFVKDLAQTIIDAGCLYLDAPVTAVPEQVEAGKTTFLIGADDAALEKARPILEAAGQKIIKFGDPGAGTVYKLMNNLIGAVHIAAAAEMLALAQKAGLDTELRPKRWRPGPWHQARRSKPCLAWSVAITTKAFILRPDCAAKTHAMPCNWPKNTAYPCQWERLHTACLKQPQSKVRAISPKVR